MSIIRKRNCDEYITCQTCKNDKNKIQHHMYLHSPLVWPFFRYFEACYPFHFKCLMTANLGQHKKVFYIKKTPLMKASAQNRAIGIGKYINCPNFLDM